MGGMNTRNGLPFRLLSAALFLAVPALGGAQQQPEASHVERFTPQEVRWQRTEQETSAKLAKNSNDSAALYERGTARINLGRVGEAVGDLREAARLDSKSADDRAGLAYGLWLLGQPQEALAAAQAALALEPNHAPALSYAGRILLESGGNPREAAGYLERAAAIQAEDANLRFDLFTALRQSNDVARANAQLRLLKAILPPSDPRIYYGDGLMEVDRGNLGQAIQAFQKALQANPRYAPARYDLARALVQSEKWPEALVVLDSLVRDYPRSFMAAYFRALALQNSHQEESEQQARRAIELGPDSADARTLLGIVLAGRGEHGEALKVLEEAARLDPRSYDAQLYLGRTRYALRDLAGAAAALRAATELRPEDPEGRFFLATAFESLGDAKGAEQQYRELVRMRPQDARGYTGLGNFQAKHGQLQEAAAALRRAHELDPANFEATLALGRTLARLGQLEEALGLLREAARMMPESAEAHYQLGLALQRTGKPEEAKKEFAAVDRLNREYRSRSGGMDAPPGPPKP